MLQPRSLFRLFLWGVCSLLPYHVLGQTTSSGGHEGVALLNPEDRSPLEDDSSKIESSAARLNRIEAQLSKVSGQVTLPAARIAPAEKPSDTEAVGPLSNEKISNIAREYWASIKKGPEGYRHVFGTRSSLPSVGEPSVGPTASPLVSVALKASPTLIVQNKAEAREDFLSVVDFLAKVNGDTLPAASSAYRAVVPKYNDASWEHLLLYRNFEYGKTYDWLTSQAFKGLSPADQAHALFQAAELISRMPVGNDRQHAEQQHHNATEGFIEDFRRSATGQKIVAEINAARPEPVVASLSATPSSVATATPTTMVAPDVAVALDATAAVAAKAPDVAVAPDATAAAAAKAAEEAERRQWQDKLLALFGPAHVLTESAEAPVVGSSKVIHPSEPKRAKTLEDVDHLKGGIRPDFAGVVAAEIAKAQAKKEQATREAAAAAEARSQEVRGTFGKAIATVMDQNAKKRAEGKSLAEKVAKIGQTSLAEKKEQATREAAAAAHEHSLSAAGLFERAKAKLVETELARKTLDDQRQKNQRTAKEFVESHLKDAEGRLTDSFYQGVLRAAESQEAEVKAYIIKEVSARFNDHMTRLRAYDEGVDKGTIADPHEIIVDGEVSSATMPKLTVEAPERLLFTETTANMILSAAARVRETGHAVGEHSVDTSVSYEIVSQRIFEQSESAGRSAEGGAYGQKLAKIYKLLELSEGHTPEIRAFIAARIESEGLHTLPLALQEQVQGLKAMPAATSKHVQHNESESHKRLTNAVSYFETLPSDNPHAQRAKEIFHEVEAAFREAKKGDLPVWLHNDLMELYGKVFEAAKAEPKEVREALVGYVQAQHGLHASSKALSIQFGWDTVEGLIEKERASLAAPAVADDSAQRSGDVSGSMEDDLHLETSANVAESAHTWWDTPTVAYKAKAKPSAEVIHEAEGYMLRHPRFSESYTAAMEYAKDVPPSDQYKMLVKLRSLAGATWMSDKERGEIEHIFAEHEERLKPLLSEVEHNAMDVHKRAAGLIAEFANHDDLVREDDYSRVLLEVAKRDPEAYEAASEHLMLIAHHNMDQKADTEFGSLRIPAMADRVLEEHKTAQREAAEIAEQSRIAAAIAAERDRKSASVAVSKAKASTRVERKLADMGEARQAEVAAFHEPLRVLVGELYKKYGSEAWKFMERAGAQGSANFGPIKASIDALHAELAKDPNLVNHAELQRHLGIIESNAGSLNRTGNLKKGEISRDFVSLKQKYRQLTGHVSESRIVPVRHAVQVLQEFADLHLTEAVLDKFRESVVVKQLEHVEEVVASARGKNEQFKVLLATVQAEVVKPKATVDHAVVESSVAQMKELLGQMSGVPLSRKADLEHTLESLSQRHGDYMTVHGIKTTGVTTVATTSAGVHKTSHDQVGGEHINTLPANHKEGEKALPGVSHEEHQGPVLDKPVHHDANAPHMPAGVTLHEAHVVPGVVHGK